MNIWEKFDGEFVMELDNQLAGGIPLLFRVWKDGTRSLATKENVALFFKDEFDHVMAERDKARIEYFTLMATDEDGVEHQDDAARFAKNRYGQAEADRLFPAGEAAKEERE